MHSPHLQGICCRHGMGRSYQTNLPSQLPPCPCRAAVTLMILDYRILFGQAAAGGEAQKSFDTGSTAQAATTGAAAKASSVQAALRGRAPAQVARSCESQAPADMELEVPRLSSSSDDSAGELRQEQSVKGAGRAEAHVLRPSSSSVSAGGICSMSMVSFV